MRILTTCLATRPLWAQVCKPLEIYKTRLFCFDELVAPLRDFYLSPECGVHPAHSTSAEERVASKVATAIRTLKWTNSHYPMLHTYP
ncbi:hypothetical protein BV22DRAFT_1040191 [Leucogyrophana mollusca]|uniref:Uncharacterized protein n=1 Tax=Leucogyrophana mollusca TaxID=85980 RepID=A0ACB8B5K6_9AGAM|nr:hypothetical protein BV22DRAFT_1040191 [Leucogyrophana mollusca]